MTSPLHALLSQFFGYLSIGTWIIVFVPQFIENYRRGSAESLSIHFLLLWSIGDILNLIGALYQEVIYTTVLIDIYFLVFDAALLSQFAYYSYRTAASVRGQQLAKPAKAQPPTTDESTHLLAPASDTPSLAGTTGTIGSAPAAVVAPSTPAPSLISQLVRTFTTLGGIACLSMILALYKQGYLGGHISDPVGGLVSDYGDDGASSTYFYWFPKFCAWASMCLYLGARLPQIAKNYVSQSCEGLSLPMFVMCVMGNFTFTLSVVIFSVEPQYLLVNLPWILGSTLTIFMDGIIFWQFHRYSQVTPKATVAAAMLTSPEVV
ncbi:putative vacuolar membrane transporter for cationic amino acids [Tieghemiomyces parasiticus]|uniref:Vacuolar membrane transporter for cationic amino acids n=1 Tax=Tieghemiomyces parasiticus TaxID=78921 RepID=A0A9W8A794_9FUNG|nr:putative vacuolar membrane transporter for cationic amino acids [Tieghemiomyces parasiticus]